MLPRHFSLPLAHASLHGQLLRPENAQRLIVVAKAHRIALHDPVAQFFIARGDAVLAAELLTEREAAYAEATQDTARLTNRLLQLLEFIREDADTQHLCLALYVSDDVSPAAVRAAARRDTQITALAAHGGLIDRAGREALQLLRTPLFYICAPEDTYARRAWERAKTHLAGAHSEHFLASGEDPTPALTAWLSQQLTYVACKAQNNAPIR